MPSVNLKPQSLTVNGFSWCWHNLSSQQGRHFSNVLSIFSLPQGPVASTASALSVLSLGPGLPPPPPPPPPPGPPLLFESESIKEPSSPSRSALFAQLNQGEAITKGEKTRPWGCLPLAPGTQIPWSPRWWIHHSISVSRIQGTMRWWAQWASGWIKKNSRDSSFKLTNALYHYFSPWHSNTSSNQGIKIKYLEPLSSTSVWACQRIISLNYLCLHSEWLLFFNHTLNKVIIDYAKAFDWWITINSGKFWKRWEYQTTWPASWETYMQVRKQQLELEMGTTDWFQIGKGVCQGCILSPCLFNL